MEDKDIPEITPPSVVAAADVEIPSPAIQEPQKKSTSSVGWMVDPLHRSSGKQALVIGVVWLVLFLWMWAFGNVRHVPKLQNILPAMVDLFATKNFAYHLFSSIFLVMKSMLWAVGISFAVAFLYILPVVRPVVRVLGKSRFLSTAGFGVIFAQITENTSEQKFATLVFCIAVFQVTSFMDILGKVKKSEEDERLEYYASIKFSAWRTVWEEFILGRMGEYLTSIKQNFAIAWVALAMVETINRTDGGIGIAIEDYRKVFKYDYIYAIQLVVLGMGILIDQALERTVRLASKWS